MTVATGQGAEAVGVSTPRVDGAAKVTGAALYVDDLAVPGVLHGATVRSTVAHGVLRAVRLDPAFDWSGVTVVTAEDIPGANVVHLIEDDQPALVAVGGRIRHVDEAVALVAAETRARAHEAAKHVLLDVDRLEAVLTIEDSVAKKVVLVGDDNVFKEYSVRRGGDVESALAGAHLVVEGTYRTGAQEQMYIETQGVVARWEGARCEVTGSLQCPYYVHKALKPLLGLGDDAVVVTQAVTGGGFGGKEEYPSMLAAHAALLSRKAGRPVKIVYDRAEDVGATTKRHPAIVRHRMGLDRDGKILAVDVDVLFDGGAYLTLSPVVLSRGVLHAAGPYRIPNVRVRGRVVATNHPPHGAFRGFGAPQTTFPYDRQIQKAARALGIPALEIRRLNALVEGDVTATGQTLGTSVGSLEVLDAVRDAAAVPAPNASIGPPRGVPVARGRGVAFYFHGAGFTGSGEDRLAGRVTVALAPDGIFEVRAASTDIGQGATTIFTQIASAALGVPASAVRVVQPSTARVPDSGQTVASRTCMVVGSVVENAATMLRARILEIVKERGLSGSNLLHAARALAKDHSELACTAQYHSPPNVHWDDATYSGDAYPVYGWAACLVDLAVDLDTYEVTLERCIHAIDVGKAINPAIVKGQIEGGTLQALGWALWESVVYKDGRVMNRRMTDCIIPTAMEAPELETLLVEKPYAFGPHGAKGVGEIPMDGPAAAVANALEDALGVAFDEIPMLPERIAAALRSRGSDR